MGDGLKEAECHPSKNVFTGIAIRKKYFIVLLEKPLRIKYFMVFY